MKHLYRILPALLLAGCTLMMDDMPDTSKSDSDVDLEKVGFDEPYTQHTELGDITFQYGENTDILKAESFDYLVKVEHDTVLYFSDNMPQRLLIKPGRYVSRGCCEELPHGLHHKVLSVEKENGMYKMTVTPAPDSEVYKELDVDLNFEYSPQTTFELPDSEYIATHDVKFVEGDSVVEFTDWAYFGEEAIAREEARMKRKIVTRDSEDEDVEDEEGEEPDPDYSPKDQDYKSVGEKKIKLFTLSLSKITKWGGNFAKLPGKGLTAKLECYWDVRSTITHKRVISKGTCIEDNKSTDATGLYFKMDFGWKKKYFDQSAKLKDVYNKMFSDFNLTEAINNAVWNKFFKRQSEPLSLRHFMVHIPLPIIVPIEYFIRVGPKVNVFFQIMGSLEFYVPLKPMTQHVRYENGDLTIKKWSWDKGCSFEFERADLCGTFGLDCGIEILTGFATVGGNFGLGIGVEFGLKPTVCFGSQVVDGTKDFLDLGAYFKPKIKAFAQDPSGNEWGSLDTKIPGLLESYDWPIATKYVIPAFSKKPDWQYNIITQKDKDPFIRYYIDFKFRDTGLISRKDDYSIRAKIKCKYRDHEEFTLDEAVGDKYTKIESGKKYTITFDDDYYPDEEVMYKVYPYLRNESLTSKMYGREIPFDEDNPLIIYQPLDDQEVEFRYFDLFQSYCVQGATTNTYTIDVQTYVRNAEFLKQDIKNWGIYVTPTLLDGGSGTQTQLQFKQLNVTEDITRDGQYNLEFKVVFPKYYGCLLKVQLYYEEKWGGKHIVSMKDKSKETILLSTNPSDWKKNQDMTINIGSVTPKVQ